MIPLLLAACASSPPPPPKPVAQPEPFDKQVRSYFFDGFRGDADSLAIGMKKTEERLATHPDDAEALVWHGAGLGVRARDAFRTGDMENGRALFERSLAEVDRARALAPENVGVLIPRGAMFVAMTMFMPESPRSRDLLEKGVGDYEATLRIQRATFDRLSTHSRGQLLYGLADGYSRLGDVEKARGFYRRLVDEVPDSPLAPRASDWLAGKPRADKVTCVGCHEG